MLHQKALLKKRTALFAGLITVFVVAAACGKDDDGDKNGGNEQIVNANHKPVAGSPQGSQPAVKKTPLKPVPTHIPSTNQMPRQSPGQNSGYRPYPGNQSQIAAGYVYVQSGIATHASSYTYSKQDIDYCVQGLARQNVQTNGNWRIDSRNLPNSTSQTAYTRYRDSDRSSSRIVVMNLADSGRYDLELAEGSLYCVLGNSAVSRIRFVGCNETSVMIGSRSQGTVQVYKRPGC